MKIVLIPDMHGSDNWRKAIDILEKHPDYYCVAVGDWCDAWFNEWPQQGDNLKAALDWFREDREHRFFCIGNHDWAYISRGDYAKQISGHQYDHELDINYLLRDNKDILYFGVELDDWVISHAGFSKVWAENMTKVLDKYGMDFSLDTLNYLLQKTERNQCIDNMLDWCGKYEGSGDETCQGPLWIRPNSLLLTPLFNKQIVGHTEIADTEPMKLYKDSTKLIVIDNVEHDNVVVFDTETEEFTALL